MSPFMAWRVPKIKDLQAGRIFTNKKVAHADWRTDSVQLNVRAAGAGYYTWIETKKMAKYWISYVAYYDPWLKHFKD